MKEDTWVLSVRKYLSELRRVQALAQGEGEPEAQLIPLVKGLLEETLGVRVVIEARPKGDTKVGKPDLGVKHQGLLVGFVELKAPGKGADPERYRGHDREQWERFRQLPNLVYTDGRDFALFREGGKVREVRLASEGDAEALRELFLDFLNWKPLVPRNPQELARFLAPLARFLREAVLEEVRENPNGELARLREEWRKNLLPEGDERVFADAYAQLITYGFLLAAALDSGEEPLYLERALELLEGRYGLLMEALFVANHPRLLAEIRPAYDLLRRALRAVDPSVFRVHGVDPWLYFYEDFLQAYDPDLRKDMGVYYTPVPVVKAMVRLVDEALKKGFGLAEGLAHEKVTVLDPAMGTGTFLLATLERALANVASLYGRGYRGQYAKEVASRLHGIELMVGPYAVAQLRLSQAVQGEGGSLPEEGLNLYLADTLEAPEAPPLEQVFFYERLAEERKRAAELKRDKPILVVLGNPPYDRVEGESEEERERKGGWVLKGPREPYPLMEDFLRPARGAGLGIHLKNLYNLYVYFWRFALWKVFEQDPERGGVLCFITPSSYLQGPAFAGMREHVRRVADRVYILDLGGEGRGAVREENVFNIQTPVAIALVVRRGPQDSQTPARVFYHRLPATTREGKLKELEELPPLKDIPFRKAPRDWQAPFVPEVGGVWARWPKLTDLFPWQHSGVQFKRTWPIGPTEEVLKKRWETLLKAPPGERRALFRETKDRLLAKSYPAIFSSQPLPPIATLAPGNPPEAIVRYGYRSFDRAWAIADGRVCSRPRPSLWRTHSKRQVYLISRLTAFPGKGSALVATPYVPDIDHLGGSFNGKNVIPLFHDREGREPNLTQGLLKLLEKAYGFPVSPEDFAAYVYALLAHPAYTERFAEELRVPGPRVPLTKDPSLFREGVELGAYLLWLHTYGERYAEGRSWPPKGRARWAKSPSAYPEGHSYDPGTRILHVGDGKVEDVAPEVYGFEVSGFFPVKSWLGFRQKNRRGRKSSPLDGIVPSKWTPDLGRELLELLWILEKTLEIYPKQKGLLQKVLKGPLFTVNQLPTPTPDQRRPPGGEEEEPQEAEAVGEEEGGNGAKRIAQPTLLSPGKGNQDEV
jgi:hypothetical protein